MSDEESAENVLSDIEADRLKDVKKTNAALHKQGKRFSMAGLKTLNGEASGAKFEIEGLDTEEPVGAMHASPTKPKVKSKELPAEVKPDEESDENWFHTKNLLDLVSQWDTLKLSQQRALGALVSLADEDQAAVESVLATCSARSVQKFLTKNWSQMFGEQSEVSIGDLAEAVSTHDRSNKHRAYLIWTMCNYEIIREKSQIGNFWETDITKSDVEAMV